MNFWGETKVIMNDACFTVDAAQVVHETLDGETVLIHLTSGVYFSLTGWGPAVWSLLLTGHSLGEVIRETSGRAGLDASPDVQALVQQLLDEDLLTISDAAPVVLDLVWEGVGETYQVPALARYDDMQYLLLIDPIHEASDTGWPAQAVAP